MGVSATSRRRLNSTRVFCVVAVILLLLIALFSVRTVSASGSQGGQPQVTLNPGGGLETTGSDGIRFTANAAQNNGWQGPDYAGIPGQDAIAYRNTYQYCCSAGGPMLNIGGRLYGEAGANSHSSWTSIEILSTTGATSTGPFGSDTGNSTAKILYTAEKNSLNYTVERTLKYTFPNDYVTDTYKFTIPDGNAEVVKFYLGGDTAPGSSDQGYGVMLTEPVRTVISLNTSSQIMFGFREVAGSKPFDGATSQHYNSPYGTVRSGGNIGFIGTTSNHDAGLMMQWNLGSTPGTQTASLEQFSSKQGTNVNAAFTPNKTDPGVPVDLSISVVNTELSAVTGLGYTFTLPAGLVIGSGSQSNTCDGTLTATAGGTSITLSGGDVGAATNCLVSIPVVTSTLGIYTLTASNISGLNNLTNNVGSSSFFVGVDEETGLPDADADGVDDEIENAAPNNGDGNYDGTPDSEQQHVTSFVSPVTSTYIAVALDEECSLTEATAEAETAKPVQDIGFTYQSGLTKFAANCGDPGYTTNVILYYYGMNKEGLILRKFNATTNAYFSINDATILNTDANGQSVIRVAYTVTDGGLLDIDGIENGLIVDPVGLAEQVIGVPKTGLGGLSSFQLGQLTIRR